jgi:hyperosmotically inducible periplasmic protein
MKTIQSSSVKTGKYLKTFLALLVCLPLLTACEKPSRHSVGNEGERTQGEELDDRNLTANVKSALNDDSIKLPDVQVAVYKGTVQLSGFTDSAEQKSRAGEIAKKVQGITEVVNNISVKEARKP